MSRAPQQIVCHGKRSHRFDGQTTCFRCGASALEVRRERFRKHYAVIKARGERTGAATSFAISQNYPLTAKQDPYAAGYEAFANDLRNPFKPTDERHAQWFEGWHTAAELAARKDQEAA